MTGSSNKFTKSQENVTHVISISNIKVFAKNKKEMEILIQTIKIYSLDRGMESDI